MILVKSPISIHFNEFLHWLAFFFTVLSILVIIFGFLYSVKNIIFNKENISFEENIKNGFDKFVLVGLQLLIVADIIDTIIVPDVQSILIVLLVVVIRTIMSWELKKKD